MSTESEQTSTVNQAEAQDKVEAGASPDGGQENTAADAGSSATDPLAAAEAERDKMRDQLLRTTADFENYKRRSRKEVEDARTRGQDDAVRELLPVFDNLERAVTAADSASDVNSIVEGVRMVLKLFDDTAQRMGLTRVAGVGERFDPNVHEAIQQIETDEQAPGTIIAEVAPGYKVGERLLRAGMVVVARPKKASAEAESEGETSH